MIPADVVGAVVAQLRLHPRALGTVAGAAGITGVGRDPRCGIDAGLQPHRVQFVAQRLEIGELFVGEQRMVGAGARALPGVVDVDVGPAVVDEAGGDEHAGRAQHLALVHLAGPAVPAVPAQRRRERYLFADYDLQLTGGGAERIPRADVHREAAGLGHLSCDLPGGGIEHQPGGQALGRERHRPVAGGRDREQKRPAGTLPIDLRAGDPRRVRRRRGEDLAAVIRDDDGRRRGAVGLGTYDGGESERE